MAPRRMSEREDLEIRFPDGRSCRVCIGSGVGSELGALWRPEWREAALVADERVMALYGGDVAAQLRRHAHRVVTCTFPPGEASKTRAIKEVVEDRLLRAGLGRQACLVALGGGISLDLGGFVAATYLRGIPWVAMPTSLLAQVDAALGGKTGVNTPRGKNLVGAFHQPAAVLVDSGVLGTLSLADWRNGLAELVKHAVIADAALFRWLERSAASLRRPAPLALRPLRRAIAVKAGVVVRDEREQGLRAILNFGHTVGHALEKASAHTIAHGQAVAVGMVVEAELARLLGLLPAPEPERLRALLRRLGLAVRALPARRSARWRLTASFEALQPYLASDKKRRDGELRLALPSLIGRMLPGDDGSYTVAASLRLLGDAWTAAHVAHSGGVTRRSRERR